MTNITWLSWNIEKVEVVPSGSVPVEAKLATFEVEGEIFAIILKEGG